MMISMYVTHTPIRFDLSGDDAIISITITMDRDGPHELTILSAEEAEQIYTILRGKVAFQNLSKTT